ncbi:Response regulator protein TodT [Paraburkholderia domus]|jgi:Response regulator|uniref:Response regulator protein TodT n=1 Tax=Paraburkholderia domus TaxID=2793075 RepID=A0A9N8R3K6_9BURK|nr:response regulator [Paraburkholderia domus]MBK5054284.1 response regulator transcription factor [Burkholderia sp. R-70006]MBK5064485.1 response regulator transcription factor [Burkholderia sp. R-70199]MBK5090153.1 response regulator transcription factor [Burkholderia sp. R-69927]MBK5122497.1 response regulator transcription factor [Burkholderia sp. R-69980]MBK5168457.1 response regulator transcription factor [Burkholderia sp. R-70211]MBK5183727.1 response regulator transcription factor [Bu
MSHAPQSAPSLAPIVYIVDDDNGMRTSLAWLLESVSVKSAGFANASEFLNAFDPGVPACLVLDVRMPEQSGFDVQAELNRQGATLPIIFVSGHGDIPMSVRALQNGAIDFVEKPYNSQQMLDRVQRALKLAAQRHAANQKQRDLKKRLESLTAREKEVLRGVIDGNGSKRIASDLSISVKTVDVHRASIKDKLGAASIAMLVRDVMAVWDQDTSTNGVPR